VEGKTQGALLFIEIDNFESIRTSIGITSADKFLSDIATLFKEKLEKHGILARFEGAMFTMLVSNADMDQAEKIAIGIVKLINEYRTTIGGKVVTATASIGLTHVNETVSNLQDCINRAEKGCEIAHKEGGNRHYIYNPAMEELEEEQQFSVWARRIKEALRKNQFQLLYQPIVSLHGSAGGNYEVLVRMLDESGAAISPGEFILAADKADLTKFIDRWIIANTFQVLQERTAAGEDIRFFIKISRGSLLDAEFIPWLSEGIKTRNLDTSKLIFELDEATALNHLAQAKVLVDDFKQLKCGTALENVGLEQNTFQSLNELPVDFIKLHAKLVAKLPQSMENQEKVKEIANEARDHNMQTIAAYVEDASSLAVLWQCSIDFIQGHFLQEPTSELNFEFENAF
jgi:multidomain signaling protein FimX